MAQFAGPLILLVLLVWLLGSLCLLYSPPDPRGRVTRRELLGCLGMFVAVGVIAALLNLPGGREAARRSQCTWRLKQIMLAMHEYADKCGSFPPAYTVDKDGRPLHSWRVLLLPFMERTDLNERIRLDEPYNSPHNLAVFQSQEPDGEGPLSVPAVFRCPSDKRNHGETNYVMVVGPRTISNGPNSVRVKDYTDGASNTIAVVETYGLGIPWYEPRDLQVDEMSFKINDPEYVGIASRHSGGVDVGLADGSVRFLPDDTDPQAVEAMTTINGGEDVSAVLRDR